uniref:Protein JASON n=1 Tax=Noccaea caerulescens TaxID=107243 RepID=A0A1J3HMH9_NOCCA
MGCLFDCFRARDEQSQSASDSVSQPCRVESKIGHDSKNRLSALFLSQEKADSSPCGDREVSGLDSMHIEKDLKDEAQFLKACGTTPIEIRKAAEKLETPQRGKQFGSSQSHSWISSNSDAVFHLDEKPGEPCEEFSEQTPSSCLTDAGSSARISAGFSDAGEESQESIGTSFRDGKVPLKAGKITGKTKSVRFELDFDQSYPSSSSKNSASRIPKKPSKTNISATSHNPTTMKLSDEIQSPVTIFPENMEPEVRGRPRIRSQFVDSASSFTENTSPCKLPEDSDESLEQSEVQVCKEKTETESPTSVTCGEKLEESSDDKHETGETSISPRVKQSKEKINTTMEALSTITHGDRPIIGMVAAHWNEEEQSQISPKWWDGNGIPNSTNKYKEDQKVNWHATSFEERLEKALSEESSQGFVPPRKIRVTEEAERDTAISQMHHSAQSTSIVSF